MSDSQHTPGPWELIKQEDTGVFCAAFCVECKNGVIAEAWYGPDIDADANARLIAAAPDLLTVVDELLATATVEMPPKLVEMAGKAMRKATESKPNEP